MRDKDLSVFVYDTLAGEWDLGIIRFGLFPYAWNCKSWVGIILAVFERGYLIFLGLYSCCKGCSLMTLMLLKPVVAFVTSSYVYRCLFFYLPMILGLFYFSRETTVFLRSFIVNKLLVELLFLCLLLWPYFRFNYSWLCIDLNIIYN